MCALPEENLHEYALSIILSLPHNRITSISGFPAMNSLQWPQ